ncbi:MAG: hypothetical protein HRU15_07525 [Planctomycetes bacterium]|nr:hypothetical protein [Planctomycetota bacterium]
MARDRKVASRRSRIARGEDPNAASDVEEIEEIEEIEQLDDEVDELDDDYDEYESDAGSSRSSRGSGRSGSSIGGGRSGRSSRGSRASGVSGRSSRASGRTSARGKAVLTPEEIEAKRKSRKTLINMFIMLIILAGVGYGAFVLMQDNPLVKTADAALASAKSEYLKMEDALRDVKPEAAQTAYDAGKEILIVPLLGDAVEKVENVEDPRLASQKHAWKAYQQLEKFEELFPKIQQSRDQVLVEKNLSTIRNLFVKIKELSDEGLDDLESSLDGFRLNPLDPEGEENQIAVDKYSVHVASLGGREQDIASERDHRKKLSTTNVQEEVNKHANKLIRESLFQEALDMIDEKAKKFPDAPLDEERDRVVQSAGEKWAMTKKNGDELYKDGTSATNDPDVRKESLKKAIKSMSSVIKKFGVDDIIGEAKDLKEKYERALRNLN